MMMSNFLIEQEVRGHSKRKKFCLLFLLSSSLLLVRLTNVFLLSFLSLFSLSLLSLFLSHSYMMLMLQLVGYDGGSESALIRKWTPRPVLSNTVLLSSITFLPLTFPLLKKYFIKGQCLRSSIEASYKWPLIANDVWWWVENILEFWEGEKMNEMDECQTVSSFQPSIFYTLLNTLRRSSLSSMTAVHWLFVLIPIYSFLFLFIPLLSCVTDPSLGSKVTSLVSREENERQRKRGRYQREREREEKLSKRCQPSWQRHALRLAKSRS